MTNNDDEAMPDPEAWPECVTCRAAYILRRAMSLSSGWMWMWFPDCKHKGSPVIATKEGIETA